MNEKILKIALDVPIGKFFDYYPSEQKQITSIGKRFVVPFRNSEKIGILVKVLDKPLEEPTYKIKEVIECIKENSFLDSDYLDFISWTAKYYLFDEGSFLFFCLPSFFLEEKKIDITETKWQIYQEKAKRSLKILEKLENIQEISENELKEYAITKSEMIALEKKGLATSEIFAKVFTSNLNHERFTLNDSQEKVTTNIKEKILGFHPHLLYGITGSGKTFVYLDCLIESLKNGGQALFLLPEINLVNYLCPILQKYLSIPVVAYHSNITKTEKKKIWTHLQENKDILVVGTRSSLFLNWKNLKMIVVDEEHDSSYRQLHTFPYDARDLAIKLAHLKNIPIILGSATVSVRSLFNANSGKYTFHQLLERNSKVDESDISLVEIYKNEIFNPITKKEITKELELGNNVLLFLNRKGYATVIFCEKCKKTVQCEHCHTNLVYYKNKNKLVCNFCGFNKNVVTKCDCGGDYKKLGVGTEKVEELVIEQFKGYNIFRVDRDIIKSNDLESIYEKLESGSGGNLILGTQILAKGHNFSNLNLAVILDIDSYLYSSDIFTDENLSQLLYQVSGRVGRFGSKGKVIIQTRYKEHKLIQAVLNNSYLEVATDILATRKKYGLPPYQTLAIITISSIDREKSVKHSQIIYHFLMNHDLAKEVKISENSPAFIEKKQGKFFWYISLIGSNKNVRILSNLVIVNFGNSKDYNCNINFDSGFIN